MKHYIKSSDSSKIYTVNIATENTCTCADFIYRKHECKHIRQAKLIENAYEFNEILSELKKRSKYAY